MLDIFNRILNKDLYLWKTNGIKGFFNTITLALTVSVLSAATSFSLIFVYYKMENIKKCLTDDPDNYYK
tara:strand:- start:1981 stop:2187 length:207 start_codon:yes stop_codon:yes gene_type:complete